LIGHINDIEVPTQYRSLFDRYYRTIPPPEAWGKIIAYRDPDYSYSLYRAQPDEDDVVLDVGCGCCYFLNVLAQYAGEVHGIDWLHSYAEWCVVPWLDTMREYKDFQDGKINFIDGNAAVLPFGDNSLDKIYSISALEHFLDDDDILCVQEIRRILKPGGIFIGTVDYNPITEQPLGAESSCRAYTYDSFIERIIKPSGLLLIGDDYVSDFCIPAEVEYIVAPLFFHLRKAEQ